MLMNPPSPIKMIGTIMGNMSSNILPFITLRPEDELGSVEAFIFSSYSNHEFFTKKMTNRIPPIKSEYANKQIDHQHSSKIQL